jgi:hypothetical protein
MLRDSTCPFQKPALGESKPDRGPPTKEIIEACHNDAGVVAGHNISVLKLEMVDDGHSLKEVVLYGMTARPKTSLINNVLAGKRVADRHVKIEAAIFSVNKGCEFKVERLGTTVDQFYESPIPERRVVAANQIRRVDERDWSTSRLAGKLQ